MSATFSEFLNLVELRGQSWCLVDLGRGTGFTVPQTDDMFCYAVLQGAIRVAGVAGGVVEVGEGAAAIILSGESHAIRNRPDARAEPLEHLRAAAYSDEAARVRLGEGAAETRLLCGRLKTCWPSERVRRSLPAAMRLQPDEMLVSTAAMETSSTGHGAAALLTRIASLLLTTALRRDPDCEHLFQSSAAQDPIARGLQLIDRHPHRPWTVSTLARSVGMGRSNFSARFAAKVGKTPMQAVTDRRMAVAAELLERGDYKVTEVGARIGYVSEAAFSRRFSRHFGFSPGQLRARRQREVLETLSRSC